MEFSIPKSLKAEHTELHEELVDATNAGGRVGEAAKEVAKRLHPHFVREEEFALPPLGLLGALAKGTAGPNMAGVLALAMILNLLLAACMGVAIPLVRARLGRDPAMGSSVLITACTDSGGFFIFLGLATIFLV